MIWITINTTAWKEIIIATGGNEKINDDNSTDSNPFKYLTFGGNDYGIISYYRSFLYLSSCLLEISKLLVILIKIINIIHSDLIAMASLNNELQQIILEKI